MRNCIDCKTDISDRAGNARRCVKCAVIAHNRDHNEKRNEKRKEARRLARLTSGEPAVAFRPVSTKATTPKQDAERLQASRGKGGSNMTGHAKTQQIKQDARVSQRNRIQAEIKQQAEYEYALRKESESLPERLRAQGFTVQVRISEALLKHLDKATRRKVELQARPGFQVLPEPRFYGSAGKNYIGWVIR